MFNWIENLFASLHDTVFESCVLPLVHALGWGGYAEQAFDATEFFLIGVIEVSLLALIMIPLEKWRPVETQTNTPDRRIDLIYTLLHRLGLLPLLMFAALLPLVDGLDGWLRLHDFIPPKLEDIFPSLNQRPLLSLLIYMAVLDFAGYWLHRAQHTFGWWWALHSLHHSQQQMHFWSDDRNHLLDSLILDAIFALLALVIGVPPGQFAASVVIMRCLQSLAHANLRMSFGRIGERLLVSPRFHRIHHAIGLGHEGVHQGCNFAVLLPVWDVLFGTARFDPVYPGTGIRDQLVGRHYGQGFWSQQWLGLKRLARHFTHS
ncbi:MAG: sterol desaturase family protein [Betaproteobacteria bacterium]|nr:sterol desaturase family protein [Betaproteobacteria bacterium]